MPDSGRSVSLDFLRFIIICLVVLHHSLLAYIPGVQPILGSFASQTPTRLVFPIVDQHPWSALTPPILWLDNFAMALLFALSGFFIPRSIQNRGRARFLLGRFIRLGIPFAVFVLVIAPMTYFATYQLTSPRAGFGDFVEQFFTVSGWPVGPAWFLSLLLAFSLLIVLVPDSLLKNPPATSPSLLLAALLILALIGSLPARLFFGEHTWASYGPFDLQRSRLLLYLAYFLVGVYAGATRIVEREFGEESRLQRAWPAWCCLAGISFVAMYGAETGLPEWRLLRGVTAVVFSMVMSVTALSLALRFTPRAQGIREISATGYGIYLVHYLFVVWMQYWLLNVDVRSAMKAAAVFATAFALSYATSLMLRTNHWIAEIL